MYVLEMRSNLQLREVEAKVRCQKNLSLFVLSTFVTKKHPNLAVSRKRVIEACPGSSDAEAQHCPMPNSDAVEGKPDRYSDKGRNVQHR